MTRGRRENQLHTRAWRETSCATCGAIPSEACKTRRGRVAWPPHSARLEQASSTSKRIPHTDAPVKDDKK